MKIAFITPTEYITTFGARGDFTLALSHLIDLERENEYEKAIKKAGLPIVCDNGLFENEFPESLKSLVEKAERINATHVFAPDVLFNTEATYEELDKTINYLKQKESKLKIAAVIQANNPQDYLRQLEDFNNNPDVDMIGLSILSIPESFKEALGKYDITQSRVYLLKLMLELTELNGVIWKPCHLLGLGDSMDDVIFAAENCPFIVSNDSSCCFQSGLFGRRLDLLLQVPGGKVKAKVNFTLDELSPTQVQDISYNINQVKNKLCQI